MRGKGRRLWQTAVLHLVLVALSVLFLVPLFWLIGSSLKTDDQIQAFPPEWLPEIPYYTRESPYVDRAAAAKALAKAEGTDGQAKAIASAYRALAVGAISFQGEGETTATAERPEWRQWPGASPAEPAELDGKPGALLRYTDPPAPGLRVCGAVRASFDPPAMRDVRNVTLQVHGDRSWRYVRVRLVLPGHGMYETDRRVLLSSATWTDVILVNQPEGAIPWGTYRLVQTGGTRRGDSRGTLAIDVLPASRAQVIFRKLANNYPRGLTFIPFGRYLLNTLLICGIVVLGTILSCSLVAYGLARVEWRGRNGLFYIIIGTMMLPFQVTMVPMFVVFAKLGWVDTYLPLTVPAFFGNAFFVFLLRQFFMTLPAELTDAARIDGCSEVGIYRRIVLPLAKPALATVGLFAFMGTWNDYIGPLIYLSDAGRYTLSLGLATFSSQYGSYPGMLMAATTVMTLPIIVLFFLAQRTFIQGIALTGLKG
jgi:ABC-type glycerol-3-phosphate transport system permease component